MEIFKLTWQGAVKWFFAGMATHMSLESVATGMIKINSWTTFPFANVFLLSRSNMVFVYMLDQDVHVPDVTYIAIEPLAYCDLLLRSRILILRWGKLLGRWGTWYVSRCIGGDVAKVFGDISRHEGG